MGTPLNIPKLGTAMSEGTLVEWLVADGDTVSPGQPLYRLETDKVENEVEAPVGGTIKIMAEPGGAYEVGEQVGEIQ